MDRETLPHQIEVYGPPRARGRMHGEALRGTIQAAVSRWEEFLLREVQMDLQQYVDRFLRDTDFLPAIERWTPDLLEEVHGIAEGAAVDFRTIFCWNLSFDEHWHHLRDMQQQSSDQAGCTAIGIFNQSENQTLLAQNNDLPDYLDGSQSLIHMQLPESDLELLIFTAAGALAQNSINNRGLGVCVNTLPQLDYSWDGLPSFFVLRALIEQETLDATTMFIRQVKHASGLNYMVGDPKRVIDFECSANRVAQVFPENGVERLFHTNHPLVNDDQQMFRNRMQISSTSSPFADAYPAYSDRRLQALELEFKARGKIISVQDIQGVLSSRDVPICFTRGSYENALTFGCTVAELSESPVLHLSPGPPATTAFHSFRFP